MNRLQKKILTIALGISNISFCLTAAAVATYAWYSVTVAPHVNVNSANMAIEGADPDESISYEVLKYDDDYKAGRSYTGDAAIANFKLPNYDSYIIEKNQYANVIIRAEVKTPVDTSTEEFTIDISRLASSFKTGGVIGSKTSNVIQFKAAVYKYKVSGSDEYVTNAASHNTINESSAATKYETASAYFADKKTPTTFVPIRDSGDGTVIVNRKSEADTITLIPDLPTGLNITNAIIYIECTYHPTLVSEFINSHNGDEMSYSLDGDISLIKFDKKTKTANQSDATGKYIKVESDAGASSGQYLPTYDAGSNVGKVLKGSLGTGIDVNNNLRQVTINNATASEPKSIDSTDTIDEEAFTYDRTAKTLQTRGGYYIGNNFASSSNYTVSTSTDPTNLTNDISFSGGHPVITSKSGKFLQHYSASGVDRIRYYNSSHPLDLYRYTENVAEMPTLVSIAITKTPTAAQRTFYTSHKFNLAGLEVTATYSDSSTAVVTNSCTFTSPSGVRTLVPEGRTGATTFSTAEASKTVYINYSEGTVTLSQTQSYTINIVAKAITSLSKEGTLSTTNWFVGDTFSATGVTVYGEYNSGDTHVDVTSSATFDGYDMSTPGSYTVVAHYSGLSVNIGTIIVRAKTLEISVNDSDANGQSYTVYFDETLTIKVTHTATVSVSKNNNYVSYTGSLSYTGATYAAQDHNLVVTAGNSSGDTTLTFSVATPTGFTNKTVTIKVRQLPVDTLSITATNPAWGTGGYFSGDKTVNTTGGTSITLNATNVMNQSGYLQIKSGGSFQSTTTKGEYIKSIAVDYQANNSYQILASVNGSSWTSIGTWNADHTATFTQSNGYKYFKIAASGGYTQLNSVTVQYYVVSVVDVTGIHSQPESYYVGETPNVNDFSLDVLMSDDTTSTVTPTSITLDTSTAGSNISGTATYSGASGTKTAAFTINIINRLVTGITVNLSTSSVSVGGTASATATITPSNATIKTVTWSSSDTSVATINSSTGAISAVAAGTCTFTAAATDGSGVTGTSTTFTVTSTPSKTLSSISLNTSGCTRVFNLGASFSYTGLIVTANYSDSTSATVTPTSVSSPTMTTAGEKTITVSYTESGTTKTATYKIIVNPEATFNSTNNSGGVSSYSNSWTNTTGGFTWNITNANNNNNGWNYIKMGSKNAAYVGTISTSAAVSYKVASVKVTIDAITSGSVNSITLYTSSNGSSWTSAGTFSKSTGTQTVTISSPSTSKYYRVSFDCAKSSNGVVTISKVQLVGTY